MEIKFGNDPITIKTETKKVIKKGYSPYIDETTGTWWEYNDTTKEYEDTGVTAEGHTPRKGVDYFTEEEINEIAEDVSTGAKGSFGEYADGVKQNFTQHAANKIAEFNTHVTDKTTAFDTHVAQKTETLDFHIAEKQNAFDGHVEEKKTEFTNHASAETTQFDSNAESAFQAFNENAVAAIQAIDNHVVEKKSDLDTYTGTKKQEINTHVAGKVEDAKEELSQSVTTLIGQAEDAIDEKKEEVISEISSQPILDDISSLEAETASLRADHTELSTEVSDSSEKINKLSDAEAKTADKLDALWKLNEGQTYDFVQQTEEGVNNSPSGAKWMTMLEVDGKTTQESDGNTIDFSTYEHGRNGIVVVMNSDNVFNITGTANVNGNSRFFNPDIQKDMVFGETVRIEIECDSYDGANSITIGQVHSALWDKASPPDGVWKNDWKFTEDQLKQKKATVTMQIASAPLVAGGTIRLCMFINFSNGATVNVQNLSIKVYHDAPSPQYPSEIKSVERFEVKHVGKNLWNTSDIREYNKVIASNGNENTANGYVITNSIDVGNNTRLYVSCDEWTTDPIRFAMYDKNGKFISRPSPQYNSVVEFPSGTKYVSFSYDTQQYGNKKVMVEFGNSKSAYEPYTEESRTIIPPRPLNAIGEYKDFADVENGDWVYKTVTETDTVRIDSNAVSPGNLYWSSNPFTSKKAPSDILSFDYIKCNLFSTVKGRTTASNIANAGWASTTPCIALDGSSNYRAYGDRGTYEATFVFPSDDAETEPINQSDLEFLRSLSNLPSTDNIFVTDNHGRDCSWVCEYIRKLNEV